MVNSYHRFLLRFITVHDGYYGFVTDITGLSLGILLTMDQDPQKAQKPHIGAKKSEKKSQFISDIAEY